MAGRERLLDPTGDSGRTADTTLSPRLRSVRGLTVGLLGNAKPNAAVLLSNVARELQRRHGLRAAVMYTKSYFGTPTEENPIQRILENCDFPLVSMARSTARSEEKIGETPR